MGNQINVAVYVLTAEVDNDLPCAGFEKIYTFFDPEGDNSTSYGYYNDGGKTDFYYNCFINNAASFPPGVIQPGYADKAAVIVKNHNYLVGYISVPHVFISYEVVKDVSMDLITRQIEGSGGLDISVVSGYSGIYQACWYATIAVTSWKDHLVSAGYQANPPRHAFGEISYDYHGFTRARSYIESVNSYHGLFTWFPTLAPGGTPQDVNVWIPVPSYERSTGIKYYLHPTVKATLKVWYAKMITGIDAYF